MPTRPAPVTAQQASDYIAELVAGNKNRSARIRMAELAISHGNLSDEAREVWREYLATELAKTRA